MTHDWLSTQGRDRIFQNIFKSIFPSPGDVTGSDSQSGVTLNAKRRVFILCSLFLVRGFLVTSDFVLFRTDVSTLSPRLLSWQILIFFPPPPPSLTLSLGRITSLNNKNLKNKNVPRWLSFSWVLNSKGEGRKANYFYYLSNFISALHFLNPHTRFKRKDLNRRYNCDY